MAARAPKRVLNNKTIVAAGTGDTDLTFVRGAKEIYFVFSSSVASEAFAAASAFQLLVVPIEGMAETGLSVATAAKHELVVTNVAQLNSAGTDDGVIIGVFPANGVAISAYKIGARLTAGGADITDCDVDIVIID